jgi:hypothetical protein
MTPEERKLLESVPCAATRQLLTELYERTAQRARDPRVLAERAKERKRKWIETHEHLHRATTRALNGDDGSHARAIAHKFLINEVTGERSVDEHKMRLCLEAIRRSK